MQQIQPSRCTCPFHSRSLTANRANPLTEKTAAMHTTPSPAIDGPCFGSPWGHSLSPLSLSQLSSSLYLMVSCCGRCTSESCSWLWLSSGTAAPAAGTSVLCSSWAWLPNTSTSTSSKATTLLNTIFGKKNAPNTFRSKSAPNVILMLFCSDNVLINVPL